MPSFPREQHRNTNHNIQLCARFFIIRSKIKTFNNHYAICRGSVIGLQHFLTGNRANKPIFEKAAFYYRPRLSFLFLFFNCQFLSLVCFSFTCQQPQDNWGSSHFEVMRALSLTGCNSGWMLLTSFSEPVYHVDWRKNSVVEVKINVAWLKFPGSNISATKVTWHSVNAYLRLRISSYLV